jgi:hypothetical protein
VTELIFRNVNASPDDPVTQWPQEAIRTALERGGISHWRRLAKAIQVEPWGPVARRVEEVLTYSRPYGVAEVMERVISRAREAAEKEIARRERAGRELLAMPPPQGEGQEPDWEDQKRELRDAPIRKWPGA